MWGFDYFDKDDSSSYSNHASESSSTGLSDLSDLSSFSSTSYRGVGKNKQLRGKYLALGADHWKILMDGMPRDRVGRTSAAARGDTLPARSSCRPRNGSPRMRGARASRPLLTGTDLPSRPRRHTYPSRPPDL